jgi:hypothetical protein
MSSQSPSTAESLNSISSCFQAYILAGWRLETQLNSSLQPLCMDDAENTAFLLLGRRVYSAVA